MLLILLNFIIFGVIIHCIFVMFVAFFWDAGVGLSREILVLGAALNWDHRSVVLVFDGPGDVFKFVIFFFSFFKALIWKLEILLFLYSIYILKLSLTIPILIEQIIVTFKLLSDFTHKM